ncbi:uncharacterized protein [Dysidea avara]|uniref:uncharacterized protein n=1 Tax=Dysidea avara TaxID=196820 RepID=UPI00332B0A10
MANLVCCLSLFLTVIVLCTYQGDATFGSRYYRKPYVAVSFSQSAYSAKESDGRVAVTVVAHRYYFYKSFSVKIKSSVNTKLRPYASSSDFDEGTQVVSFSSRQTKATAYIRINNDNKVEYTEGFKVEILISRDVYNSGVKFGGRPTANVYIKNDDIATTHPPSPPPTHPPTSYYKGGVVKVRLSQKVYRVKESDGFAVIKLLVSGHRRSSIQIGARTFIPTKFDLPAG